MACATPAKDAYDYLTAATPICIAAFVAWLRPVAQPRVLPALRAERMPELSHASLPARSAGRTRRWRPMDLRSMAQLRH